MNKLLLDENLPAALVPILARHGLLASHVENLGLVSTSDRKIWNLAVEQEDVIVTKDADYLDLASITGSGRVILLAVGNLRLRELCRFVDSFGSTISEFVPPVKAVRYHFDSSKLPEFRRIFGK